MKQQALAVWVWVGVRGLVTWLVQFKPIEFVKFGFFQDADGDLMVFITCY